MSMLRHNVEFISNGLIKSIRSNTKLLFQNSCHGDDTIVTIVSSTEVRYTNGYSQVIVLSI